MPQEDIIALLVNETFSTQSERPRVVEDREEDFALMTQISRLPLQSFKASFVTNDLLEFSISGKVIHVSIEHLESGHMTNFTNAVQLLSNYEIQEAALFRSSSSVWFLGWKSSDEIDKVQLAEIFRRKKTSQAA